MALRVLIVDDSEVTRRILRKIIHSHYWDVCGEAENGWSGVKKFQELKPDVVVLDLGMPDIDGLELGRVLRRFASPPQLVFVSAYDSAAVDASLMDTLTSSPTRNRCTVQAGSPIRQPEGTENGSIQVPGSRTGSSARCAGSA